MSTSLPRRILKDCLLFLALLLSGPLVAEGVPALVFHQGHLSNGSGEPLSGNVNLEFNVYDGAAPEASVVWGPKTFTGITVAAGNFHVLLGPADDTARPIQDAFSGPERYLGVKVNGGAEVQPRQRVLSSPFAFHAAAADTAEVAGHAEEAAALTPVPEDRQDFLNSQVPVTDNFRNREFENKIGTVELRTTGRPVLVGLQAGPFSVGNSYLMFRDLETGGYVRQMSISIQLERENLDTQETTTVFETILGEHATGNYSNTSYVEPNLVQHLDTPPAGRYRYSVLTRLVSGDDYVIYNVTLFCIEL